MKAGLRDALPILLAIAPYALVFGVYGIDQGMSSTEVLLASATIFAVASQYVMVELMGQDVPIWSILLAVLAVNFRHVLYSASLVQSLQAFSGTQKALAFFFLTDPQFASSAARATRQKLRPSYYFSYALVVYFVWICANILGSYFGRWLGDLSRFGLDFLLPMFFASLVIGFRHRPGFSWVLTVSVMVSLAAFYLIGSPWHITLGGFAGIATAALRNAPKSKGGGLDA
ncbi:AzlC family ABC transporter permease [Cognatishimia sp. WU-CL00825]